MKKIFLFCLLMLTALVYADEVKRVAILEVVDREGKLSYSQKLMLRSNLARAVTNTKGFERFTNQEIGRNDWCQLYSGSGGCVG